VNRRKPRVQTPVVSRYPAPTPFDVFVLLFLPPCGPHLTMLATGSLESGLLVSPLLRGPARHRSFTPTLHLHQRKSSRNLHLQYSAKRQSTPRSQSLITARSNHLRVLGCSSPQRVFHLGEIGWILQTPRLSKWRGIGLIRFVLTPVLSPFLSLLFLIFQVGGMEGFWLIDSSCSRHMTGDQR
jgi:hypothetical protein